MRKYKLINSSEPNLYETIFNYNNIPIIEFDNNNVEMNRPQSLWITDTTFRDGQQSRPPYEIDQIVNLYKF